ncbi:hypothetical protein [Thalassolituus hydrocarboniclasticus]|uniref:Uncharacterized protein n=1 Tax=Thalassolituus hydrocarboniclasticus TaxID=2742796 RepID=A0ABY6ACG4_9GAMM|nr:hypothetical protein [Thalassolituus hydrocarboniclasticus]UXD88729.1 hypothetical protein HUF19_15375 [Thalassolituus hydrocarboniclasticus]
MDDIKDKPLNTVKLPVVSIIKEASLLPFRHFPMLLRAGLPLLIVMSAIVLSAPYMPQEKNTALFMITALSVALIALTSFIAAIIACHRIFLLDNDKVMNTRFFPLSGQEPYYIGWAILIALCCALVSMPLSLILTPVMGIFATAAKDFTNMMPLIFIIFAIMTQLPLYYLASRWSLALPAAAVGLRGKGLSWAWQLSAGNGWRLLLLTGFLPLLINLSHTLLPSYDSVAYALLQFALWLLLGAIQVGLLSLSFSYLYKHREEQVASTGDTALS